jgi:DNA-binding GntR family transcriptional regulator
MKQYGASSLTVQKAMGLLREGGWAVSRPGKGAFVSQRADFDHAFETVTTDLERLIRAGDLTPGAKLPSRQALAEQYQAPITVVDAALAKLVDEHWLRRDENGATLDVHVRDADDPAMANRLAHAALVRRIEDGTLAQGAELTAETAADLLGTDAQTAQQALNLLILEHRAARVRRGIPLEHGGMSVEEVTVIGHGPGRGTPDTLDVYTGPSPEELQTRRRIQDLADALDDALEQIDELRQRLDRMESKGP